MSASAQRSKGRRPKVWTLQFWDDYWFYPAPLFNLAICRIAIVAFQVGYLIFRDNMSQMASRATVPSVEFTPLPVFQALNVVFPWDLPPLAFMQIVFVVALLSGVLSLVGFKTRFALPLFALVTLYIKTYIYSHGSYHHTEAILHIALFALAFSPSGQAISVDDFLRRKKNTLKRDHARHSARAKLTLLNPLRGESAFARWPVMLVQWLFGITYLSAAINKILLDGEGLFGTVWMNGYTLQSYFLADGTVRGSDLGIWLGHQHLLSVIFSWVAVIFEGTFFLTLLFPKLIWFFVPAAAMFHIGIFAAQRADFFQYLALYAVFFPWTAIVKAIAHRLQKSSSHGHVFYSSLCPSCTRNASLLRYFNWFEWLTFHPQTTFKEVTFSEVAPTAQHRPLEGETLPSTLYIPGDKLFLHARDDEAPSGFQRLRTAMKYVPPLWPILLVMYLPGVNWFLPKHPSGNQPSLSAKAPEL